MNKVARLASCASALALIGVAFAQPVSAAPTQATAGECQRVPSRDSNPTHFYCWNTPGIRVEWAGETAGYLMTNLNWFICRYEGDPTGGGGPHPNRWIYTLADGAISHNGWGFVKDSDVKDETNPLPVC
ncbi:hypothetical protein KMT30_26975 [Streptomyces sp. IBSBF 2953]|uniref:hypothetical protein n=1 Tax=Streptomyces TaxID=1883 RepID=UPI00211A8C33|nr:hypothetical protein [Streptomyces scabiei]MCQ9182622.1 hypothetical protein [Streptomyces hayashii]MDX3115170.1 hypothetical protein [Streptomyces scabiei]